VVESESGIAPGSTGALAPYSITESGRAKVVEPSHVVAQGFTYPRLARLSIDMQRKYYKEELVTANNFSANMLTICWTRGF
jgi:hypothetical protein